MNMTMRVKETKNAGKKFMTAATIRWRRFYQLFRRKRGGRLSMCIGTRASGCRPT
uniref:Sulfotransferase n=1 Tax=Rhizophora mucronata TaxID=61149 RepID=A0A2P2QMP1_RHIMU